MTNSNRIKLTWISFFSYALTGALVIVTGMVMGNIAEYFHVPVSSMSNTFTFLNAGILISIFLNAWLMEIVPLKTQLRFGFILMVLAVAGLVFGDNLTIFSAAMFVLGLVSGITMSIGTFLITHMYEGRERGSRLLFTDSFFSMAGMIFPMVAAILLARSIDWYWVYVCIGLVYVAIFILTFGCDFPALGKHAAPTEKVAEKEKWGVGVLFLSIAALCYILGQLGFISWVPEYAKSLGMNLNDAGQLVSDFWMSYMFGMWAFSFILRFFDLQRILTVLAGAATVLMYLFNTSEPTHLAWFILALGFFSSAIYTSVITLGSLQTKVASPKLVNFVLTCGTIGTMLTFVVTGPIVAHSGPHAALQTANGLYAVVFVMCLILGLVTKHRQHNATIH
ncbi:TsgA family protein [Buttiauxella ferragutiae ATCC 51602]|jgi:TsgA-like MFS transporter|uniref:Protein TsgA homolog n=1 Tax=Buttiauxella ferragutiae ATCC 51602 TaxID=1354252 RepID=A0ABX2WBE9_9ENTR|nr:MULTISPECIES: MFS transporter TsgA [Buttiauxella]AYN28560.1 MFS transporter TsgA [Buttiauxella sp. 3AFRM03]MCE0827892.1 MFS transporter TsgA [Buttiauxella ferragutiae]OAT29863.1 TsgA family protein [Buttiauxella ferragutiae ATCC 51602]TDN52648.1 TsgA-like MFS transporter [Buttiauxella sp. JUb87]UNK61692.1 MFS transporter TsgA [Buttiauxella ferragutiae]